MISSSEGGITKEMSVHISTLRDRVSHTLEVSANALSGVIFPLSNFLVVISALLTFIMATLILIDIFLRIFFRAPIAGSMELEQLMLATLVFFTLAYAMIKGSHVSIDIISSRYTSKVGLIMQSIFSILSTYLFIIICWQNVERGFYAMKYQEIMLVTEIPLSPFIFITAFGSTVITLVFIINLLKYQAELVRTTSKPWRAVLLIWVLAVLVMISPVLLKSLSIKLPFFIAGVLGIGITLSIMLLGMPIAFVLGLMGFLGLWYLKGVDTALQTVRMSAFDSVANYFFCVIPFFVLMGYLCFHSGLSKALYRAGHKLFGQLPGGLSIGTVFGCAGFAAICGDSMATAGTMGSVSVPEMKKYGYQDSLATGCVAAGGTLGILIPPSIGFIIYGLITEQSIGKLFMAGILPGIALASIFSIIIYIRCRMNPALGPPGPKVSFSEKVNSVKEVWPILTLFLVVIGGIYLGFFTPTEGGGIGTIVAIILGILKRSLSRKGFYMACLEGMALTSTIFGIVIGVKILEYFIGVSEISLRLADIVTSMHVSRWLIFVFVLFIYLILGMVMNIIPMIMITLPIIFPTIMALGFDPIWFGVVMVIMMEMGQITPPVGVNVFVIASIAKDVPMARIFKGVFPFVIGMLIIIIILVLFPDLALILPNSMDVLPSIGE
jgi:tripartite ATP-independent transporter DctM subunit